MVKYLFYSLHRLCHPLNPHMNYYYYFYLFQYLVVFLFRHLLVGSDSRIFFLCVWKFASFFPPLLFGIVAIFIWRKIIFFLRILAILPHSLETSSLLTLSGKISASTFKFL